MLAVISDLHFEEEASDAIRGQGREIVFRRNLEPNAYRSFLAHMADEARHRRSREFELIIAGDLFDFSRTVLWFRDELRPYVSLEEASPKLEQKIVGILEATAAEPPVAETLEIFRLLSRGSYKNYDEKSQQWIEAEFPCKTKITVLGGNHDRVANLPSVRRRIRARGNARRRCVPALRALRRSRCPRAPRA